MLSVRLAPEIIERLELLAHKTGEQRVFMRVKPFSDILRIWRIPLLPLNGLKHRLSGGL